MSLLCNALIKVSRQVNSSSYLQQMIVGNQFLVNSLSTSSQVYADGSGSGKGGGSGGSVRDAGGSMGKRQVAQEEGYFHKLNLKMKETLKEHLDAELKKLDASIKADKAENAANKSYNASGIDISIKPIGSDTHRTETGTSYVYGIGGSTMSPQHKKESNAGRNRKDDNDSSNKK